MKIYNVYDRIFHPIHIKLFKKMPTTNLAILAHNIYEAIKNNNEEKFNTLFSFSNLPLLNEIKPLTGKNFESPLQLAIKNPNIFEKLLIVYRNQIDVDTKNLLLMQSAAMAYLENIKIIITYCENEISRDCIEILPLSIIGRSNNAKVLSKIIYSKDLNIFDTLLKNKNLIDNYAFSIGSFIKRLRVLANESKISSVINAYDTVIKRFLQIPDIALIDNVQNGNLASISRLLNEHGNAISPTYKKAAIEVAIEGAQFDAFDLLLADNSFQEVAAWNNNIALLNAKNKVNSLPTQIFYQKIIVCLMNIPSVAFLESSTDGDISKFKILLKKYSTQLSVQDKGYALINAAKKNNLEIIKYLLRKCGHEIHKDDKGVALILASEKGNCSVVEMLTKDDLTFKNQTWIEHALLEAHLQAKDAQKEDEGKYQKIIKKLESFSLSKEDHKNIEPDPNKVEQLFKVYPVSLYSFGKNARRVNSDPIETRQETSLPGQRHSI